MMRIQQILRIAPIAVQVHRLRVRFSTDGRCDPLDPPNPLDRSSLLLLLPLLLPLLLLLLLPLPLPLPLLSG